jgi:hypothetical protein
MLSVPNCSTKYDTVLKQLLGQYDIQLSGYSMQSPKVCKLLLITTPVSLLSEDESIEAANEPSMSVMTMSSTPYSDLALQPSIKRPRLSEKVTFSIEVV